MNLKALYISIITTIALSAAAPAAERVERTPSFPGAEGWGRYVTGGRGGKVDHVTTLNDNGKGSLRAAVEASGPRIVVFDVSGTIHLHSDLAIRNGNITIAGQTAPGDGICIADFPLTINSSNVVLRYLRLRPGNKSSDNLDGLDALSCNDTHHIMVDHCSLSWSTDECCSVYGNTFSTVQWCLISQSLRYGGHSKETHGYGGMMGGEGASYHHNMLVHHDSRCPRLGERPATGPRDTTDFRCNVMYNWSGLGCYGAENMNVNILNNYYKPGPATRIRDTNIRRRICGVGVNEQEDNPMYHVWATIYVDGNVNPDHADVTRDNWNYGIWMQIDSKYRNNASQYNLDKNRMRLTEPVKYYYVTTHSAEDTYNRVLEYAGASLSRDSHDELMVSDTRLGVATYTGKGEGDAPGIIDSPDDNRPVDAPDNWSAWPTLLSQTAPVDTDGDGMPDEWELANGLDPTDAADGNLLDEEGYTMVEVYINSLVDHITEAQNESGTADGYREYYPEVRDSYEISMATRTGNTGWDFDGGISLSGGSYANQGNYVSLSRNNRHTVTLPERARINRIKVQGYGRYTGDSYGDASLTQLGDNKFDTGTYSLPKGSEPGEFTVDVEPAATGTLDMMWSGNNPCCVITLYTDNSSLGIGDQVSVPTELTGNDKWYNLQGIEVAAPFTPGLYINKGKKILIR